MKSGTDISGADNTHGAQTGTCFRAGPLAFTDTGKALVEVIEVPEISPVGGTQPWFSGLAVYRSELLPVTDFTFWAGLSEKPGRRSGSALRQSTEDSGIKQRILVVQHPDDSGDQAEKIGLLVDEVSGHVVLDQAVTLQAGKTELTAALREQLNELSPQLSLETSPEPSPQLLELVKGTWSSPGRVFLVELQELFAMDSFIGIALHGATGVADRRREVLYS